MTRVLVIVVTYNGRPWLDRCLGSVNSGNGLEADIFVVDNDSTDGSADYVRAHFPSAKLVRSAENLGFSKANNLGMQYALDHGYDYVYLLNQDAWLAPGALETLVAASEAHPEYAVLSPLQMTDGYKEYDKQFSKLVPKDRLFMNRRFATPPTVWAPPFYGTGGGTDSGRGCPSEPASVKRVMAAHWLVRVDALGKVGLFNETLFPMYGQDDNWCHRALYHGYRIGIVPEARAVHDRAQRKEPRESVINRNYYIGSLVRLCDINHPLWERFLYVILFTLVKSVKYFSIKPVKGFVDICRQIPQVRNLRTLYK